MYIAKFHIAIRKLACSFSQSPARDISAKKFLFIAFCVFSAGASLGNPITVGKPVFQVFQKPLQHDVSVSLKLVQVYVTDRKGNPVTDLRQDEFAVYDNGRPVDITEFEKHALRPARFESVRVEEKSVPTPVPSRRPIPLLTRKYFLFFDFAYNSLGGVKKAKEAALYFIDRELLPGDEVGLLSISLSKGLVVHEYLSTDHVNIRRAVAALDPGEAVSGRAMDIEEEYWRRMAEGKPRDRRGRLGVKPFGTLNTDRAEATRQAEAIVDRISNLARALRDVPGQKHFLFFSTGVPGSMIYGYQSSAQASSVVLSNDGTPRGYDFGDPGLRKANEDMYRELAASGCSVFSFDTREAALTVPGVSLFAYDAQTFESGHRDIFYGQGAGRFPVELFKDDKISGGYTIGRLSKTTGGEYFSNINEFEKSLAKVQSLTGNYYVLGYRLAAAPDGLFHELEVKVLRKGCVVRSQSGYFNPKAFREFSDFEKSLHLVELALAGKSPYEIPLTLPLVSLPYISEGESRLEILARLTPDAIEKFLGRRVEIITLIFDDQKTLVDLRRSEADLSGYRGMDVFASADAPLNLGRYDCRVVVRDLESGAAAVASGTAEIEERLPAGLKVNSPLLLCPGGALVYLDVAGEREDGRAGSWSNFYIYDRARWTPIVGTGVAEGASRLAAVVPCTVAGILAPRIALQTRLIDRVSGKTISLPILSSSKTRKGELDVHFLEFSLAWAPAGDYDFVVRAEDAGSGLNSEAKSVVRITS